MPPQLSSGAMGWPRQMSETTGRRYYYGAPMRSSTLHRWSVSDFKCLEFAEVDFPPLTLLCGENSSGKSSLIQSMLLAVQSTEEEVVLNGPLVRLGLPSDIVRYGQDSLALGFSLTTRPDKVLHEYHFDFHFGPSPSGLRVDQLIATCNGRQVIVADSTRVTERTRSDVDVRGQYGDALLRLREVDEKKAPPRSFVSLRGLAPEAVHYRPTPESVLATLRREYTNRDLDLNSEKTFALFEALADWLGSKPGQAFAETSGVWEGALGRESPRRVARLLADLSRSQLDVVFRAYSDSAVTGDWATIPAARTLSAYRIAAARSRAFVGVHSAIESAAHTLSLAADALRAFQDQVRYLGPLREEPQVVSPTGARYRNMPVGPKGEYTADLLSREGTRVIRWAKPDRKRQRSGLLEALSFWTSYLGVGEHVAVEDQGKLGRGLRINVDGVDRDLTMVGVGASQVLPVLAVVLSAPEQAVVLLEQPELHLHPAVQSRLGDFFLFARPDLRIIVETHSEYLVTRIRRRVAEGGRAPERIAVLFAEREGAASLLRKLALSKTGDLSDWPRGFFDTQDQEGRAIVGAIRASQVRVKDA